MKEAIALRAVRAEPDAAEYQQRAEALDEELTCQLRNRILRDDDNQRLLNGVGARQDGGNLLRFLRDRKMSKPPTIGPSANCGAP